MKLADNHENWWSCWRNWVNLFLLINEYQNDRRRICDGWREYVSNLDDRSENEKTLFDDGAIELNQLPRQEEVCINIFDIIQAEPHFLDNIITRYKTWTFQYDPQTKSRENCEHIWVLSANIKDHAHGFVFWRMKIILRICSWRIKY